MAGPLKALADDERFALMKVSIVFNILINWPSICAKPKNILVDLTIDLF